MNEQNNHINDYQPDKLNDLLGKLRTMDSRNIRDLRRWQMIIGITAILFILLLIIHPMPIILIDLSSFLAFFIIYTVYYFKLNKMDYSIPVKQVLIKTRRTYRFLNPAFIMTSILIIPMIFGSVQILLDRYLTFNLSGCNSWCINIFISGVFYILLMIVAYVTWHAKYNEIIKEINHNLKELED